MLDEPEAPAIHRTVSAFQRQVSSRLLGVELRRLALRRGRRDDADGWIQGTSLIPIDQQVLASAERLAPPNLGTLDAIHLATALRLHRDGLLDALMTYDARLAGAAREHGIDVLTPR